MISPVVFTDFHHAGLLHSLILLFENRFNGLVYRPIGMEWHNQGYWAVYDHPATALQFLGIGSATPDNSPRLNEVKSINNGVYNCYDIESGKTNKAVTLDGFMNMHIDYVIASLPIHIAPYRKLCNLHPSHPKLIFQIGNSWDIEESHVDMVDGILSSAITQGTSKKPYVQYHQEFDLDYFRPARNLYTGKTIKSYVNVFGGMEHFKADYELFEKIEQLMPDYTFLIHGGQGRDNPIGAGKELAENMQEAMFIWHTKNGGDGYGHTIHQAFAVGRPLIVKKEYYRGKLAEPLIEDGITCVAIDGLSPDQIVDKIRYYAEAGRYQELCVNAYCRFKEVVNFDHEEILIKQFLDSII